MVSNYIGPLRIGLFIPLPNGLNEWLINGGWSQAVTKSDDPPSGPFPFFFVVGKWRQNAGWKMRKLDPN